jgi:hypothetical protein
MALSESAVQMLRELVEDHRDGIKSGNISYGRPEDNQDALETLDELDALTDTQRVPA